MILILGAVNFVVVFFVLWCWSLIPNSCLWSWSLFFDDPDPCSLVLFFALTSFVVVVPSLFWGWSPAVAGVTKLQSGSLVFVGQREREREREREMLWTKVWGGADSINGWHQPATGWQNTAERWHTRVKRKQVHVEKLLVSFSFCEGWSGVRGQFCLTNQIDQYLNI